MLILQTLFESDSNVFPILLNLNNYTLLQQRCYITRNVDHSIKLIQFRSFSNLTHYDFQLQFPKYLHKSFRDDRFWKFWTQIYWFADNNQLVFYEREQIHLYVIYIRSYFDTIALRTCITAFKSKVHWIWIRYENCFNIRKLERVSTCHGYYD